MNTHVLAVVLGRGGSKGLPRKNLMPLAGRPLIAHAIEHARAARRVDAVVVSSDAPEILRVARIYGVGAIARPADLAGDTAPVDAAVRHAVEAYERGEGPTDESESSASAPHGRTVTHVVILYGNVPLRPRGLIDRAIEHLVSTGADSVRSVQPVTKQHPDWVHRLDGDRLVQFRANSIHRRQDLEPVWYHDGAVLAVSRSALFAHGTARDPHAFLGSDRRAVVHDGLVVDVDTSDDLRHAEALLGLARGRPATAIAGRLIGQGHPVFVIAEAGVNHDGSLGKARELIDAARSAGADAVKFQLFHADRLAARGAACCAYQKPQAAGDQREMLRRLELPAAALSELKARAEAVGLIFLATPFGLPELDALLGLNAPAIKIASPDIVNAPLLRKAAASGRPVIASTGAADVAEVDDAVMQFRAFDAIDRLALLHCVSAYPAPLNEARLACIRALADRYGVPAGFSDHTDGTATGALAVAAGACILEKHLTLDRAAGGPDHFFSLEPGPFAEYVARARGAAAALGDGTIRGAASEAEVRRLARGSMVAVRSIPSGAKIRAAWIDVQRPGDGISPAAWTEVIGRQAACDIPAGTRLTWAMVR